MYIFVLEDRDRVPEKGVEAEGTLLILTADIPEDIVPGRDL